MLCQLMKLLCFFAKTFFVLITMLLPAQKRSGLYSFS